MTSLRPQVSVIIPAYGPAAPVVEAVDRLLALPAPHLEVIVVNNDTANGLAALLPPRPRLSYLDAGGNTGFTGAVNLGWERARGEFILLHNADLIVDDAYLLPLIEFMASRPNVACVSGLLLRTGAGTDPSVATVDSAGIVVRRDRGAHDRGEGAAPGDFTGPEEVFAVSGAALFARRIALEDIAAGGFVLDPAFFMYKDDVDLAWRLRLRGWECWFVPAAVGYHVRAGRGLGGKGYASGFFAYLRNERRKPAHIRVNSLKNEWLLLVKYETAGTLVPDLPWILVREVALVLVTFLVAPRHLFRAIRAVVAAMPAARAARRDIASASTVSPRNIRRRWFLS